MPEKKDYYSSYGQKLISLFAKLLFTQRSHSLIELSKMLNCSKQTVLRMVGDIRRAYGVDVEEYLEGKRKFYRIKRSHKSNPSLTVTASELQALDMCKTFAEHLIGKDMFEEASRGLEKNQANLSSEEGGNLHRFDSFPAGSIDYSPYQETIQTLIIAMNEQKVCLVVYRSILETRTKTLYIKPLKIFSHKDSVYVHAQLAKVPGKKYVVPTFDPLLAIHRIKNVEMTDRRFEYPVNYDFDKAFKQHFGLIKEDAFDVEIEFKGYFAKYIAERIWSPVQTINKKKNRTVLTFTASSKPELISWVLSFGEDAKVMSPEWLIESIRGKAEQISQQYNFNLKSD